MRFYLVLRRSVAGASSRAQYRVVHLDVVCPSYGRIITPLHTVLRSQCPIVVCPVESPPNGIVLLFFVVVVVIVGATLGSGSQIPPRLSCLLIVVSEMARPLSDEGSRIPQLCWPRSCWRWREMDAASAILCRRPSSSTLGSTASALPPLARRDVLSWAIALRGSSLPAPSVRGLGGSQTLGMHDGTIGGSLGGLLEGIRPRAAKAGRWRWMDGRRGKMLIAIGEVVVASLGDESTPGLGVAAAALSSLA